MQEKYILQYLVNPPQQNMIYTMLLLCMHLSNEVNEI